MHTVDGKGNNALSLAILSQRLPVVRFLLERGADTTLNVVYRDARILDFSIVDPAIIMSAISQGQGISVIDGNGPFFIVRDGIVTTDLDVFTVEKHASMKELARLSGDKKIIELLSAGSK